MQKSLFVPLALLAFASSLAAQWIAPNPVTGVQQQPDGVQLAMQSGAMRIQVTTDSTINVLYSPASSFPQQTEYVVLKSALPTPQWKLESRGAEIVLVTSRLKVTVTRSDGLISYSELSGRKLVTEGPKTMTPATVNGESTYHAEDNIAISSHLGTHVDAPWHTGSKTAGKPAKTVDQIPLEELFCDGVVLDVTHKKCTGQGLTVEDLQQALKKIDYKIKPGDAVMMRIDHDKFELTDPVRYNYPGMTRESTLWLAEQGAKVGGTDALGWDRPFHVMIAEYQRTKQKSTIWDAHYACRDVELYVVQQLVNLDKLPPHGFQVCFFPILLVGASAAPARVVAFVGA